MFQSVDHLPADVLGLSDVARTALAGRPHPPGLPGMCIPARVEDLPRPPDLLPEDERALLADTLEEALAAQGPHVRVLESVRALRTPGACMVIAGQQPGFLGGPLYNVYKAVHAIRLAAALREAWGVPVVPAFWNHADDHDVAEVHHLWLVNSNLDLFKLGLGGLSSGRVRFGDIVLDDERHHLTAASEALRQALWQGESADRALEQFTPRAGETFSGAFTRLLLSLFGHHGLVVVEPDWIRASLSSALADVLQVDVHGALEAGSAALTAAGGSVAIEPSEAALLFQHRDGRRHALRSPEPNVFRYDDEPGSRSASELAAEIVQDRSAWSAGALLRPLAQDRALPIAAYVGGWGELAYHAQLPPLRAACGLPATPFVPRLSATLVDPEASAALRKLELALPDVLASGGNLDALVAAGDEPEAPPVIAALRAIATDSAERLAALRPELEALDRGLAAQLKRTGQQIGGTIEKLVQKAERVQKNSQGRGRRHVRRLQSALLPREAPQERVRGAVEFVARFGPTWIDELLAIIEPLPTEHLALEFEHTANDHGPVDAPS